MTESEANLHVAWIDLSDKAREDIARTLKDKDSVIAISTWTSIYDGNPVGCLMMDGHAAEYVERFPHKAISEASFLQDKYGMETAYEIKQMASAFDNWASEQYDDDYLEVPSYHDNNGFLNQRGKDKLIELFEIGVEAYA
jgi:hypothetical protein